MTNYIYIGDFIKKLDLIAGFTLDGCKITYYLINDSPSNYYTLNLGSAENAREAFISLKKQICIDTPK